MGQKPEAGSIASFCHTRARPGSTLISSSLAGARQTWAHSTSNSAEPFVTRIWLQQKKPQKLTTRLAEGTFHRFSKADQFQKTLRQISEKVPRLDFRSNCWELFATVWTFSGTEITKKTKKGRQIWGKVAQSQSLWKEILMKSSYLMLAWRKKPRKQKWCL